MSPAIRLITKIFLLTAPSLFAGCANQAAINTKSSGEVMQIFRLSTGVFKIDEGELEAIRQAVIEKLASETDMVSHSLKEELQKSIAVISSEDTRIGPWVLSDRNGVLVLIRIPPRSMVNYLFVAKLSREGDHWLVIDFYQERMTSL